VPQILRAASYEQRALSNPETGSLTAHDSPLQQLTMQDGEDL